MIQCLILIAGKGSRTQNIKPYTPKALIKVHGKSLLEIVTANLKAVNFSSIYYFVTLKDHCQNHGLEKEIKNMGVHHHIVQLEELTSGAACSALCAKNMLDLEKPLIIANADQLFINNFDHFLIRLLSPGCDGLILTMKASGAKWSYVKSTEEGRVLEVQEKKEISNIATVGIYGFKKAKYFIRAAEEMISKDIRTNNEFYLAPCFNEMIAKNMSVYHESVGDYGKKAFGLGTEEDISLFLKLPESEKILQSVFR